MSRRAQSKPYKPNFVPSADRALNVFLGVVLSVYGIAGLLASHMNLNGRRIRIAVLEGRPAWLMAAAFLVGAAVLFSVVIDHYDTRDNERYYRAFRWCAIRLGWCLAIGALSAHLYIEFAR